MERLDETDERILAELAQHARATYAEIHGYLHDADTALHALALALAEGLLDLAWLDLCPLLLPLHKDPRFVALRAVVAHRVAGVHTALGWREPSVTVPTPLR